jgi:predicted RNA-binding protein with PIN domain
MADSTVVDGMNVIGSRPDGWWRDRDGAARRLLHSLQATRPDAASMTLVLEGRPLADLPEGDHDGVRIAYARRSGRNAGDDRVVELVAEIAADHDDHDGPLGVRVVTSDRDLATRVRSLGAIVTGAGAFLTELERSGSRRTTDTGT